MAFWVFVLAIISEFLKSLHTDITNKWFVFYKNIGGCGTGLNLIVLIYSYDAPFIQGIFFIL